MTDTARVHPRAEVGGRPRVVVFDPIPGDWSWAPERAILGARGVDLIVPADAAAADEAIRTADAVIVTGVGRLDASRVASLERCVGILCYSIGMDKVDAPAAAAAGIPIRNVPDYWVDPAAPRPDARYRRSGSDRPPRGPQGAGFRLPDHRVRSVHGRIGRPRPAPRRS